MVAGISVDTSYKLPLVSPSGGRFRHRDPTARSTDSTPVAENLSFLDLFYAVPVSDLAVRISDTSVGSVSAADWSVVAVEIVALFFSWVGLHQNRSAMAKRQVTRPWISESPFWSARFPQFCLEVSITALYFVVGLTLQLPDHSGQGGVLPSETWVLGTLLAIFFAYALWDLLDVKITSDKSSKVGGAVTSTLLVVFAIAFLAERRWPATSDHEILVWNLGAIAVLYGYRVIQEKAKAKWSPVQSPRRWRISPPSGVKGARTARQRWQTPHPRWRS